MPDAVTHPEKGGHMRFELRIASYLNPAAKSCHRVADCRIDQAHLPALRGESIRQKFVRGRRRLMEFAFISPPCKPRLFACPYSCPRSRTTRTRSRSRLRAKPERA